MAESKTAGMGLSEAIEGLRADLMAAMTAGASQSIQFPIAKMTVELQVVATRSGDGKAGFKAPITELELGGTANRPRENTQTVTIEFGSPVDHDGRPVIV